MFLRYTEAIFVEKANIIQQQESQILRKNLEIDKYNERCEIIPEFSIQSKREGKIASQHYKNIFSDGDNFVFECVRLNLID